MGGAATFGADDGGLANGNHDCVTAWQLTQPESCGRWHSVQRSSAVEATPWGIEGPESEQPANIISRDSTTRCRMLHPSSCTTVEHAAADYCGMS